MARAALEVADIFRTFGPAWRREQRGHLNLSQLKVMSAVEQCRSAALGGHVLRCGTCQHSQIAYNSCRNRHCPRCQGNARARWLAARSAELLPVPYFHIVFTLPHEFSALILQNKRLLYDLLFRASATSLLQAARDPRYFGAQIGFLGVLHTWGQSLEHHPHIHYIVPAGGLAVDSSRWIDSSRRFFLPVKVLSRIFRRKFSDELRELFQQHRLQFHNSLDQLASPDRFSQWLRQLGGKDWVVYAKPPFGGAEHVLNYLARYTHRVAISNHRLVAFEDHRVSFRWRDYAHGGRNKVMTVPADEFLRRYLLHVLPKGLVRIRHFGLFANRRRGASLERCRSLLGTQACADRPATAASHQPCPLCSGPMIVVERITAQDLRYTLIPSRQPAHAIDSS